MVLASGCGWLFAVAVALSVDAAQPAAPPAAKPAAVPAETPAEKPAVGLAAPAKAKTPEKEKEAPAPKPIWLETKDGWRIHCVYYAPKEDVRDGKEVVPIIMLHGWGGQGGEYGFLAAGLQTFGYAVMVPDLRGHGRSVGRRKPDGDYLTIKYDDPKNFLPIEMKNMFNDVEAVKKWLIAKNNEGEVNIDMLCVIGAEFGAALALNWAALDWSWPATTAGKQGQDVKALVLLSPSMQNAKGYTCTVALGNPAITRNLSVSIAVGEKSHEAFSAAKRIHGRLETGRPKLPADEAERERKQSLFWEPADTDLQGTRLLDRNLPINLAILNFLKRRLLWKQDAYPWSERQKPVGN